MLPSLRMMFSRNSSGLAPHGLAQAVVERRKAFQVRPHHVDILELQPLAGEILHQRGGLRVAQHPRDLRVQHGGLPQIPLRGRAQQFRIGHAAPQEVGEPRRQLVRAHRRPRRVRAPPAGSRSMRYRKFGDTRTASSAVAIPSSNESPCLRARLTYPRYSSTSGGVPDGGTRGSRSSSGSCARRRRVCFPGAWPQT